MRRHYRGSFRDAARIIDDDGGFTEHRGTCSTHDVHLTRASSLTVVGLIAATACSHPVTAPPKPAMCGAGTFAVAGACVTRDEAEAYCGKAALPELGGCVTRDCASGEPTDLASGECVPFLTLQSMAATDHVALKDGGTLGCAPEAGLVVEGEKSACIPHAASCGRGAQWVDAGCHPTVACPPGTVPDTSTHPEACVAVVHKERQQVSFDVGTWVRLVLGPDGGSGTDALCGPLALRPWRAGLGARSTSVVLVRVDLVFPDNEVSQARVNVSAHKYVDAQGGTGDDVFSVPVGKYLDPLWKALREVGGVSNAASATVKVRCAVDGGPRATSVPRPGAAVPPDPLGGKPPS